MEILLIENIGFLNHLDDALLLSIFLLFNIFCEAVLRGILASSTNWINTLVIGPACLVSLWTVTATVNPTT